MKYLILIIFITACGYQTPEDQCVGKGTNCHGQKGDSGSNGSQGTQGLPGRDGTSCTTTQDGTGAKITCSDGSVSRIAGGTDGTNGTNGQTGPQGSPGTAGSSCTVQQVTQGALITCGTGPSVLVSNGSNGQNGTAGTVILPVKFCPNVVPKYPSVFPEYGLCIGGNLYAVYSANDGFLTEIPPGQYQSDAVGSSCTFTVLSNCGIQ